MTAHFDFTALFASADVSGRKTVVRKPAVRNPVTNTVAGGVAFNFSAADLEHVKTSHRGRPASVEKKFARETFWDKYTKEGLKLLREVYGVEEVNIAMMNLTLEEMGQKFDLDALELKGSV